MKRKMIKAIIIGIAVIVIGVGSYAGYNNFFNKTATATTTKFYSSTIKTMDISKTIQGTGAAYAGTSSAVAPNNNGTISDLTVKVGDTVTKSQKLFVSSSSNLTKAVTDATQQLTKANAQLTSDENNLTTTNTQLVTGESASKVDTNKITSDNKSISDTNSKISDDKDSITNATSQLTSANSAVANQVVTSPIGGLVTAVNNANGDSGQSGRSSLTVTDMNTMKVKVAVDELDISSVAAGQKATIKFDALTGKTFTGTVETIAQTGTTSNNTTTYDVVVSISNPTGIRLGMNANVTIAVKSKANAIVIPEEALVENNSKNYVRVQNDTNSNSQQSNSPSSASESNSKLVEITTGIETEDYVEVTKGVTAGQVVLVQLPSSSSSTNTQRGMGGTRGSYGGGSGSRSGSGGGSASKSGN